MAYKLKPLAQQRIVLTGASSGIGLAIAEAAVAAGARVMLSARNETALSEISERLSERGGDVSVFAADVANTDYADRLAAATVERFGGFDTWVNDAAAAAYAPLARMSDEDHRRVFDVGYFGTVRGSLAAVAHLRDKGGALINIGSVLGDRAMIFQGAYSAMKHAVKGFTEALRTELIHDKAPVSVTLIKPAAMHTPYPQHAKNQLDTPVKLPPIVYDPRLVAKAVLFAAQHPKRDITVGGVGAMIQASNMFPALTDLGIAAIGKPLQEYDEAAPAAVNDNLHQPKQDGDIESDQDQYVRRTSLWLEAQMRPAATVAAFAGLTMLAIAAGRRR